MVDPWHQTSIELGKRIIFSLMMGIEGSQAKEEADVIRTDRLAFPVQIVKPTASTYGLLGT